MKQGHLGFTRGGRVSITTHQRWTIVHCSSLPRSSLSLKRSVKYGSYKSSPPPCPLSPCLPSQREMILQCMMKLYMSWCISFKPNALNCRCKKEQLCINVDSHMHNLTSISFPLSSQSLLCCRIKMSLSNLTSSDLRDNIRSAMSFAVTLLHSTGRYSSRPPLNLPYCYPT